MTAEPIINHAICRKSSKIHIRVIAAAQGKGKKKNRALSSRLHAASPPPGPYMVQSVNNKISSVTYKLVLPSVSGFRLMLSLEFE